MLKESKLVGKGLTKGGEKSQRIGQDSEEGDDQRPDAEEKGDQDARTREIQLEEDYISTRTYRIRYTDAHTSIFMALDSRCRRWSSKRSVSSEDVLDWSYGVRFEYRLYRSVISRVLRGDLIACFSSAGVRSDRPLSSLNPGGCKYEAASVDTQKGRRDVIDGVQAGDS
ncbi:hypothetical protein KCU67_g59, partial [Aureobasidium melanogenum]